MNDWRAALLAEKQLFIFGAIMRLSEFLRSDIALIMADWEAFAQGHIPAASDMTRTELRDHLSSIIEFIATDMDSAQTNLEQREKSKGEGVKAGGAGESAAETHANIRFTEGFDPLELMAEFRALRASITRLWDKKRSGTAADYTEIVRFNEAIDQVQTEGFTRYIEKVNYSRNLFLATLVHDLRDPLGTISLATQLMRTTILDTRQTMLAEQVDRSVVRTVQLVNHLIDDVRARLGKPLPITPQPMDMGSAVSNAVSEIQIAHPAQKITVRTSGLLHGEWDSARIGQLLSNLIGNAVQHGKDNTPVDVTAEGDSEGVTLSIRNDGVPIPPAAIHTLFDPLTRAGGDKSETTSARSLGLGLFIVREIVRAHGGTIKVVSTKEAGTTFSVRLPNHSRQ